MIRIVFFDLAKLVQPDVDGPIRDQLDVLEADHFTGSSGSEFPITGHDVNDLGRFQRNSFGYCAAPPGVVRLCNYACIRSRRTRAQQEGIGKVNSIYCD